VDRSANTVRTTEGGNQRRKVHGQGNLGSLRVKANGGSRNSGLTGRQSKSTAKKEAVSGRGRGILTYVKKVKEPIGPLGRKKSSESWAWGSPVTPGRGRKKGPDPPEGALRGRRVRLTGAQLTIPTGV